LRVLRDVGYAVPSPKPKFGHGAETEIGSGPEASVGSGSLVLVGSYHPSQQNTFTGRLTREMFDAVWSRATEVAG
ncbi:MAG: uracil-DNA glycosylase, partial [Gemmatimonadetes bacterium]|nr:uracil-DNA glycosylase [Gemmatimonadota bacterium]